MSLLSKSLELREKEFSELTAEQALADLYDLETGRLRFTQLKRNLLYYANYFQFEHGDLLRAILGREVIYDTDVEESLIKTIDLVYHELMKRGSYDLSAFKCVRKDGFRLIGRLWEDGVPCPKPGDMRLHYTGFVYAGDILYIRRNTADSPNRADLEFFDRGKKKVVVLSMASGSWDNIQTFNFKKLRNQSKLWEFNRDEARRSAQAKINS